LPARYGRARLETFETREPWQANALNVAYGFAREFEPGARGLLFYGRSGTGKTHLSVALLRFLLVQRGVRARFVEFSHLISDLREAFSGKNAVTTLMSPLTEVPLLVIDELGKGASGSRTCSMTWSVGATTRSAPQSSRPTTSSRVEVCPKTLSSIAWGRAFTRGSRRCAGRT
jgi:DNA replication protein DnaC